MRTRPAALLLLALALALAVPLVSPPRAEAASQAAREFSKRWAEAGADEAKKKDALDQLFAQDKSEDAARLFLAIALNDESEPANVVDLALRHLGGLEGEPGDAFVLQTLKTSKRWEERALMVRALAFREGDAAIAPLAGALDDKQWQVAAAALEAIARHRTKDSVEALIAAFERLDPGEKDPGARRLSGDYRDALERLCGEKLATARDWRNWWTENRAKARLDEASRAKPRSDEQGVTAERAPRLFDEVLSRRVIFILDTSASMQIPTGAAKTKEKPQGLTRFDAMRLEAKRVVDELPPEAKFNVVTFADSVLPLGGKLENASDSKKKAAAKFIDSLKPAGQTNSFGALEAAFKDREVDTIYFLSDGFPTGGKLVDFVKICQEVRKWNATRNVRIHTIAFLAGDGAPLKIQEGNKSVPKAFMKQLAEENSGHYKLVE